MYHFGGLISKYERRLRPSSRCLFIMAAFCVMLDDSVQTLEIVMYMLRSVNPRSQVALYIPLQVDKNEQFTTYLVTSVYTEVKVWG